MSLIGDFFGFFMYWCYRFVHNYGLTIILFTLITKIILLPISIMVQKNSIKMVQMYPEMNRIKAKCMGNKDMISEEQFNLYKKHNYNPVLDIIPVVAQLVILMGVIDVIYKPLRHLLKFSAECIDTLISTFTAITGISPEVGSIQIQLVSHLSNSDNLSAFMTALGDKIGSVPEGAIDAMTSLNLHFCGFDFGVVPWEVKGVALLMPLLAAASSWLMCFTQNKSNVLQSAQSKGNQWSMLLISVGLSLYLGLFVPAGVGFYWIVSNLMSIVQMYILNWCINPKNYIDYEELEKSKQELAEANKYANDTKKVRSKEEVDREKADCKRFEKYNNKQIVFYSEKNGFYKYFKDVIEAIHRKTDIVIHYISSDPNDEIFKLESDTFKTYYIGENKLIAQMMKMEADIVVLTMPDLQKYHIKRSMVKSDIEYIYMDHAVASANMTLRKHALDHFDTIFATNELMKLEMREMEKTYGLKEKNIVEYGYSLIDNMIANYEETHKDANAKNETPEILIAPSWQDANIMDANIEEILDNLSGHGYHITVRPHPQYVRHFEDKLKMLADKYKDKTDVELQLDFSSNKTVFDADVLITDWSGIAYEYSFTTLKPTLFINTPMKIMNPDYKEIDIVPFDIEARDQVGISVDTDKLSTLNDTVQRLLIEEIYSKESLASVRSKYLYNVGKSANVGANYIIKRLIEASKK